MIGDYLPRTDYGAIIWHAPKLLPSDQEMFAWLGVYLPVRDFPAEALEVE